MKCADCPYYWIEEGDDLSHCHYRWNDGYAPCEVEDSYEEDEEDFYDHEDEEVDLT
jgi:hypothetical protein